MAEAEQHVTTLPLEGDAALLRQYAKSQEPAAFEELSRRYAGVVYGTCLRITANVHDAEELTQDCFFELARRAAMIHSSVGGWLHSLAIHRALNAVRSRNRRREHEQGAATVEGQADSETEVAWRDLEPLLDQAIDGLPEEFRTPIILHFLESRSQTEVALRLGVHQSTVSRRIQEALEALRARLHESGFVMAVAPLTSLLATHAGQAPDAHLLASLMKIALAGVGSAATGKAIGGVGAAAWLKLTAWCKALGTLAFPFIVQLLASGWWGVVVALTVFFVMWRWPSWSVELNVAMGGKYLQNECYPFSRWTWTTPPADWRKRVWGSLWMGLMFGILGVVMLVFPHPNFGMAALMMLYAMVALITAARIWIRVHRCPANARETEQAFAEPPDAVDIIQSVVLAVVATLFVASLGLLSVRCEQSRNFTLAMMVFLFIFAAPSYVDAIGKILSRRRRRREEGRTHSQGMPAQESSRRWRLGVLIVGLVYAGLFTLGGLITFVVSQSIAKFGNTEVFANAHLMPAAYGMTAILPPLALLVLITTICPFHGLRARLSARSWRILVGIGGACAVTDLVLCVAWLLPVGWPHTTLLRHTTEISIAALRSSTLDRDPEVRLLLAKKLNERSLAGTNTFAEWRKADAEGRRQLKQRGLKAMEGEILQKTVATLRKQLDDPDKETRIRSAWALGAVAPGATDAVAVAVSVLRESLGDQDSDIRFLAAYVMGQIGSLATIDSAAKDAVPELRKALGDEDKDVRWSAAWALVVIGPAAKDAIPELRKAAGDPDRQVRCNAVLALGRMSPAAKDAIPELRKALRDPDKGVRADAAWSLGQMGPAAKSAVPDLQKALDDEDHNIRSIAASALKNIEHGGK
jgi:RNA polymerase sigma factor (sigma-70 family)